MTAHIAKPINHPNAAAPRSQAATFLLRWAVSALAMWICIKLFATPPGPISSPA